MTYTAEEVRSMADDIGSRHPDEVVPLLRAYADLLDRRAEGVTDEAVSLALAAYSAATPPWPDEMTSNERVRHRLRAALLALCPVAAEPAQVDRSEVIDAYFSWDGAQEGVITNCESFLAGYDFARAHPAKPAQPADSGRVGNADHSRDLRHLIYLDTQFNWRGETDLKLPEMQALEARGWITEGAENGEYYVTEEGESAIEAALAAQGQAKVYQCPRCATAMQVDPTAKPAPPASPAGVPDEWKRALDAAHYYIDATDVELEEDRMTRADALRHARNLREALSQESQPNG